MKTSSMLSWLVSTILIVLALIILNYPPFDLTFGLFKSADQSLLWPSIIGTAFNIFLFLLTSNYLIPVTLRKKGIGLFLLYLLLSFLIVSGLELLIDSSFAKTYYPSLSGSYWVEMIIMITVIHLLTIVIAAGSRFTKDWFKNERIKVQLREWQLKSELDVLKAKINPHFLFNALNNLFSMSLQHGDEKTAEGIAKLSEMMRYVFDWSSAELVSLDQEIQYIEDYIYLQLLRFEEHVSVHFSFPTSSRQIKIAPMLLIPFVENAFKYGVSPQQRTAINIQIGMQDNQFQFKIENEIPKHNDNIDSSGIGIQNVKQRLALIYPKSHDLVIKQKGEQFTVALNLKLA